MHKIIHFFALIFIAVPTALFAQKEKPQPCTEQIQEHVALAMASVEKSLESLKNLESLHELESLSKLNSLAELESLSSMEHMLINQDFDLNSNTIFDSEKTKTFDKTYKVSKSDILAIENKFGKVHVNTWNKNEIRVKVDVIGRAGSDAKAQEILDKINIKESKSGSRITVKTEMESMNISGNSKKGVEVNYTIYMPDDNELAIKNEFGDIFLPDFKGKTDLNLKYGTFKGQRMLSENNKLIMTYSHGNCTFINKGNISLAYSDFTLDGTNGLQGSSKFGEFKIGKLSNNLDLDVKYGSLRVDNISKNMQRIQLSSGFSPVTLNFEDNTTFNFDVNVQFGNFNVDKSLVNITSLEKGHTSAEYKGKYGTSSSKGQVTIVSKYGDVKFTN